MRKPLIAFGIFVLCLPLLFSLWLLTAVTSSKFDSTTMHAPTPLRQFIASAVIGKASYGKQSLPAIERALRLDPDNRMAIDRKCMVEANADPATSFNDCSRSLRRSHSAVDYYRVGNAQLARGEFCDAENNLTTASSKSSGSDNTFYLNRMGVAAIRCNELPGARAALEAALELDQKSLAEPNQDEDELDDGKASVLNDQELLIIVYQGEHEKNLEVKMCSAAHPGKSHCTCKINKDNNPSCA